MMSTWIYYTTIVCLWSLAIFAQEDNACIPICDEKMAQFESKMTENGIKSSGVTIDKEAEAFEQCYCSVDVFIDGDGEECGEIRQSIIGIIKEVYSDLATFATGGGNFYESHREAGNGTEPVQQEYRYCDGSISIVSVEPAS